MDTYGLLLDTTAAPYPEFDSPMEARIWCALREVRPGVLPDEYLTPQFGVVANGRQYYLDFACHAFLPEVKVGIEIDGWETHSSPMDIARDRRRQRDLERDGWQIIRYGGSEVYHSAENCAEDILWFIVKAAEQAYQRPAAA